MRNRNLIFILTMVVILAIVFRKLGFGFASIFLNVSVFSLAVAILFSQGIFRTILARVALCVSLLGALAILQYWLESAYIIIPSLLAIFIFELLSFKYVQRKASGALVFLVVFGVFFLSVVLNPRQFHNLFRPMSYEDFVLLKYRQDQGLIADLLINTYKRIDIEEANRDLKNAFREDSLKNNISALEYYSKSIENNPDNPIAYHRRGFLKLTRLDLNPPNVNSALKDFSRAIRLDEKFAEAYYHRSMAYHYLGNKERSFLDQLKVLQLDELLTESQFEIKYGRSKKSLSIPPDS